MVDEVRVVRLLRAVTDDLAFLEKEATAADERRRDPMWLRGVKYSFVTMIEACVDVAQHVCAAEGWGPPRNNADTMRLLAEHEVIGTALGEQLRRAVGFRNVLVHEYIQVDDEVVIDRLDDLDDVRAFTAAIAALLAT